MDDESFKAITKLGIDGVRAISKSDFLKGDTELKKAETNRTTVEFYFTCTPSVILYALNHVPDKQALYYVDADFYFFSSTEAIQRDMGDASIYITEHRFPFHLKHLEIYGKFNVGIIGIRNDAEGKACITRWREQCIEWCYDRVEECRFADQKYLDLWPDLFPKIKISEHSGVNAAPWNKDGVPVHLKGNKVHFGETPLVCYHFQGLRLFVADLILPQAIDYGSKASTELLRLVYIPYLKHLRRATEKTGLAATAKRYSTSPTTKELWRRRGQSQYIIRLNGHHLELNKYNAVFLLPIYGIKNFLADFKSKIFKS
jgi:hypothetical protein